MSGFLASAWDFLAQNQILVMMILFFFYNHIKMKQPFPESGGRVTGIHSEEDWEAQVLSQKGLVVVDFFAVWCPPCRSAAPVYGELSTQFLDADFVKVDVDELKRIARSCGVSSMPTFQLYSNGKMVDQTIGFSRANIEAMLRKHSASSKRD